MDAIFGFAQFVRKFVNSARSCQAVSKLARRAVPLRLTPPPSLPPNDIRYQVTASAAALQNKTKPTKEASSLQVVIVAAMVAEVVVVAAVATFEGRLLCASGEIVFKD